MLTVSATDRVVMQDEAMLDLEGMGNPVSVSSSDRVVMQVAGSRQDIAVGCEFQYPHRIGW